MGNKWLTSLQIGTGLQKQQSRVFYSLSDMLYLYVKTDFMGLLFDEFESFQFFFLKFV